MTGSLLGCVLGSDNSSSFLHLHALIKVKVGRFVCAPLSSVSLKTMTLLRRRSIHWGPPAAAGGSRFYRHLICNNNDNDDDNRLPLAITGC
jgi:hypothetical protein